MLLKLTTDKSFVDYKTIFAPLQISEQLNSEAALQRCSKEKVFWKYKNTSAGLLL